MNGVTLEQMIGAVDEQVSGLRQMVQRPDHDVPQYWTDLFYCLNTTSAFLRKIAEPSDADLDTAARAYIKVGCEVSGTPVFGEDEDEWREFRKAHDAAFRAALATLHQPELTEDKI